MTMPRWLETRTPAPPAALRRRLADVLDPVRVAGSAAVADAPSARPGAAPGEMADACLAGAERMLDALLRDDCATRAAALDLLAADALATYAFEAAAESPAELPARAAEALRRFARLGADARAGRAP